MKEMQYEIKKAKMPMLIAECYDMGDAWQMLITCMPQEQEDHTLHSFCEAWIRQGRYGIMSYMFGSDLDINNETYQDFVETAYYNFEDYKDCFLEDADILDTVTELHWRMK